MAGLGSLVLAGAVGGLGKGMVDRANAMREERLAEAQQQREDAQRAENRQWDVADRADDRAYNTGLRDEERSYEEGQRQATVDRNSNVYESLFGTESGGNFDAMNSEGYGGRSQFGQDRLDDWSAAAGTPRVTVEQFRSNPDLQKEVEQWHFADINSFIDDNDLTQFEGQTIDGVPITRSGMIAMAHLGGEGGMRRFLESGGEYNPADSNGTHLSDYARTHAGLSTDMSQVWDVLGDPETPAAVRDDITRGLGIGAPTAPEGQYWRDNGDGTETRLGVDARTGQTVEVMGPDGKPLTQTNSSSANNSVTLSAGLDTRLRRMALLSDGDRLDPKPDEEAVLAVSEEILRLMREEGLDERSAELKALRAVQAGMVQAMTEPTNGFLGIGGSEAQPDGPPRWNGQFNYGEASATADAPVLPGEPTSRGLGATAVPDPRSATNAPAATAPETTPADRDTTLQQARDAIAAGADRTAVEARLREMGIDPKEM